MRLSIKHSIILLLAVFAAGCNDNYISTIPDFPVYMELNLTTTYPTFKNSSNQYLTFTKPILATDRVGYGGILVYSAPFTDDNGNTEYYAFDMSCPYEHETTVRVEPQDSLLGKVVCEKCGSVFDVSFGTGLPESGPAKQPLKRYKTIVSGDMLVVTRW